MKALLLSTVLTSISLTACSSDQPSGAARGGLTGADRDGHGCIPSAGYRWCARTAQCERPWELAKSEGFENTPEQFDAFCNG